MTYPIDRRVHQPSVNDSLSDALGQPVRTAQRPPYNPDTGEGKLVVLDVATGEELDDLDPAVVRQAVEQANPPPVEPSRDDLIAVLIEDMGQSQRDRARRRAEQRDG